MQDTRKTPPNHPSVGHPSAATRPCPPLPAIFRMHDGHILLVCASEYAHREVRSLSRTAAMSKRLFGGFLALHSVCTIPRSRPAMPSARKDIPQYHTGIYAHSASGTLPPCAHRVARGDGDLLKNTEKRLQIAHRSDTHGAASWALRERTPR